MNDSMINGYTGLAITFLLLPYELLKLEVKLFAWYIFIWIVLRHHIYKWQQCKNSKLHMLTSVSFSLQSLW